MDVFVKKLVRLALASEYSRQPIRKSDINAKVFGEHSTRQFKVVFDGAQRALKERFGMEMIELPAKEKITVRERRGMYYHISYYLFFFCFYMQLTIYSRHEIQQHVNNISIQQILDPNNNPPPNLPNTNNPNPNKSPLIKH